MANISPPPFNQDVAGERGDKKFSRAWILWINELHAYVKNLTLTGLNWGSIGGTLANQADLTAALNAKVDDGLVTASGLTMNTNRLLGRSTVSTGAVEEITVGTGLTLSLGTLTSTSQSSKYSFFMMMGT